MWCRFHDIILPLFTCDLSNGAIRWNKQIIHLPDLFTFNIKVQQGQSCGQKLHFIIIYSMIAMNTASMRKYCMHIVTGQPEGSFNPNIPTCTMVIKVPKTTDRWSVAWRISDEPILSISAWADALALAKGNLWLSSGPMVRHKVPWNDHSNTSFAC